MKDKEVCETRNRDCIWCGGVGGLIKGMMLLLIVVGLFTAAIRIGEGKIMFKENAYQQCTSACSLNGGLSYEITNVDNGQCIDSCNYMLLELSRGGRK